MATLLQFHPPWLTHSQMQGYQYHRLRHWYLVTVAEVEAVPRLMRQRMLTQRRLQVATYTTRRLEGTSRKLTAWAGIQNRHDDWNVVTNFSLRSQDQRQKILGWDISRPGLDETSPVFRI